MNKTNLTRKKVIFQSLSSFDVFNNQYSSADPAAQDTYNNSIFKTNAKLKPNYQILMKKIKRNSFKTFSYHLVAQKTCQIVIGKKELFSGRAKPRSCAAPPFCEFVASHFGFSFSQSKIVWETGATIFRQTATRFFKSAEQSEFFLVLCRSLP